MLPPAHGGANRICPGAMRQLQPMVMMAPAYVAEDGDPEAKKVVRGWRIWRDLSTTSTGGGGSGVGKARGRSLADMPQRYVPRRAQQARSSAQKTLMEMVLLRFWRR